jgi:hypothetical protein
MQDQCDAASGEDASGNMYRANTITVSPDTGTTGAIGFDGMRSLVSALSLLGDRADVGEHLQMALHLRTGARNYFPLACPAPTRRQRAQ